MDFHFGTIVLGSAVNHGIEIGEKSLAGGHRVSARDQFQRAAYYIRISLISMIPTDADTPLDRLAPIRIFPGNQDNVLRLN